MGREPPFPETETKGSLPQIAAKIGQSGAGLALENGRFQSASRHMPVTWPKGSLLQTAAQNRGVRNRPNCSRSRTPPSRLRCRLVSDGLLRVGLGPDADRQVSGGNSRIADAGGKDRRDRQAVCFWAFSEGKGEIGSLEDSCYQIEAS